MVSRSDILVVVPCGRAKIWDKIPHAGPTRARDAYTGSPFKVNRAYAECFGDSWVILSAEYGFLDPDDFVEGPYNVTFKRRLPPPIGQSALRQQVQERRLDSPQVSQASSVLDNVLGMQRRRRLRIGMQ